MSVIPQRPRDTPLLMYHTTGMYSKPVSSSVHFPHPATPGESARIFQRNQARDDDMRIKPITQETPPSYAYKPQSYLKPYDKRVNEVKDIGIINKQTADLHNRKQVIDAEKAKLLAPTRANFMTGSDFHSVRSSSINTARDLNPMSVSVTDNCFINITRKDDNFFKKRFGQRAHNKEVSHNAPDFFKVREKEESKPRYEGAIGFDGTVTLLSKAAGWITVTPDTMNRRKPFERAGMEGDASKSSKLTPSWMHPKYSKPVSDPISPVPASTLNLRSENRRMILADKEQRETGVFNYGVTRHNVHTKEDASKYQQNANKKDYIRPYDWRENQSKQRYDNVKVTGKIGSPYPENN